MKTTFCSLATLMLAVAACPETAFAETVPPPQPSSSTSSSLWTKASPARFVPVTTATLRNSQLKAPAAFELPFFDEFDDGDATRANTAVPRPTSPL
ncbi:MAG: hypothetical protein K2P06_05865 [Muribaculaceae bacterium]|nr:hypothetical protein [Muribaculaceae bacterium]